MAAGSWPEACVLSRVGILRMWRSIWLASGRQEGIKHGPFRMIFAQNLSTPRIAALGSGGPGNAKGAFCLLLQAAFITSAAEVLLATKAFKSLFPVPKILSLCLWKFLSRLQTITTTRKRIFPAGLSPPRGRIRWSHKPLPPKPFALLGPKPTFVSPTSYQLDFYNPALWV